MILGIDVGNYSTKTSEDVIFKSTVSLSENLLNNKIKIKINGLNYYIGQGYFDTELNKADKTFYLPLLFSAIALSSNDIHNSIVVGLPLSQYHNNKDKLKDLILTNNKKDIIINDCLRQIIIDNVEIYAEGLASSYMVEEDIDYILTDIGGRTTDIIYIFNGELKRYDTVNVGMFNVLNDIANYLNAKYTTNLDYLQIERIIEKDKLIIGKEKVDLSFTKDIIFNYYLKIKDVLDLNYSAKSERIVLTGGGAEYFKDIFSKKYNVSVLEDNLFSNAYGLREVGNSLWG